MCVFECSHCIVVNVFEILFSCELPKVNLIIVANFAEWSLLTLARDNFINKFCCRVITLLRDKAL